MELKPIGFVRNEVKRGDRWEEVISRIEIEDEFSQALDGIEDFSHIIVIFWFHLSAGRELRLKIHPRGIKELPEVGVFATRSPLRPNPIGISVVRLLRREGNILTVKGLDALDGTPVVDIKPYMPFMDSPQGVLIPPWAEFISRIPYTFGGHGGSASP